jgi:hypothetical protein
LPRSCPKSGAWESFLNYRFFRPFQFFDRTVSIHVTDFGGFGGVPWSPSYVSAFLTSTDGLALTKAVMRVKGAKLRRRIVDLVKEIAGEATKDPASRQQTTTPTDSTSTAD